jgi:nicotinamide N-methyltransferase
MADHSDNEDLFTGNLMDEPEDYYPPSPPPTQTIYTLKSGHPLTLNLVGSSPTEAHHLWNGAKIISDYFEALPSRVAGKTVLELGAAAGLPSLVAGLLGAEKVVMSDYPDVEIVQNMQKNIDLCDAGAPEPLKGKMSTTIDAAGFIWGADVLPLLQRLPASSPKFDVLILADLLFRHSEHGALVKTIKEAMKEEGTAYVFFTSYRPWMREKDMKFFDVAREAGMEVVKVEEVRLEKPMFEGDPGDLEVQKTVTGWELTWPQRKA